MDCIDHVVSAMHPLATNLVLIRHVYADTDEEMAYGCRVDMLGYPP